MVRQGEILRQWRISGEKARQERRWPWLWQWRCCRRKPTSQPPPSSPKYSPPASSSFKASASIASAPVLWRNGYCNDDRTREGARSQSRLRLLVLVGHFKSFGFASFSMPNKAAATRGASSSTIAPSEISGTDAKYYSFLTRRFWSYKVMIARPGMPFLSSGFNQDEEERRFTSALGMLILPEEERRLALGSRFSAMARLRDDAGHVGILLASQALNLTHEPLKRMIALLQRKGVRHHLLALSRTEPTMLGNFLSTEAFVVFACPMYIAHVLAHTDEYHAPLLSPYEAEVALSARQDYSNEGIENNVRTWSHLGDLEAWGQTAELFSGISNT